MRIVELFEAALKSADVPFDGVFVGPDATDRSAWRVSFRPDATDDDRRAAAGVIAALDISGVKEPRYIDSRVVLERMTDDECHKLFLLAHHNATICKFVMVFLSRAGRFDVNDPLAAMGWTAVKAAGVTPPPDTIAAIWPDAATADTRVAAILALPEEPAPVTPEPEPQAEPEPAPQTVPVIPTSDTST